MIRENVPKTGCCKDAVQSSVLLIQKENILASQRKDDLDKVAGILPADPWLG